LQRLVDDAVRLGVERVELVLSPAETVAEPRDRIALGKPSSRSSVERYN